MMEHNRTFHWGYPGGWRVFESANVPHCAAGAVGGLIAWVFGALVWPGLHMAFLFSLGCVIMGGALWEIKDYYKADGFDWLDLVCDVIGFFIGYAWHLAGFWWDG